MKLMKKCAALLMAVFMATAFVACSGDDDDAVFGLPVDDGGSNSPDQSNEVSSLKAGDTITMNGTNYIVLANTYYSEVSRSAARSASRATTIELSDDQKNLINKYTEWVNVKWMLSQANVENYLSLLAEDSLKNVNNNVPYQDANSRVFASDSIYFYNSDKKKVAEFRMNWESATLYPAATGGKYNDYVKSLEAVNWMEEKAGFEKSSTAAKKKYTNVDIEKYTAFRTNYEPNKFKVISYPENVNPDDLSKKKEIQCTFYYNAPTKDADGNVTGLTITLEKDLTEEEFKEAISELRVSNYYQMINNKARTSYAEQDAKGDDYSKKAFELEDTNLAVYGLSHFSYTDDDRRENIQISAKGVGDVGGTITESEYLSKTAVTTRRSKDASALFELTKEVTGSKATYKKIRIWLGKSAGDTEKNLLNMKVTVKVTETKDGSETEKKKDDNSLYTLLEAITTYFADVIAFSTDTTEICGYIVPNELYARAKFLNSGHNKDYTKVTLTAKESEGEDRFIYDLECPKTLTGNAVPDFVYTYATNMKKIYESKDYVGEAMPFTD